MLISYARPKLLKFLCTERRKDKQLPPALKENGARQYTLPRLTRRYYRMHYGEFFFVVYKGDSQVTPKNLCNGECSS